MPTQSAKAKQHIKLKSDYSPPSVPTPEALRHNAERRSTSSAKKKYRLAIDNKLAPKANQSLQTPMLKYPTLQQK